MGWIWPSRHNLLTPDVNEPLRIHASAPTTIKPLANAAPKLLGKKS